MSEPAIDPYTLVIIPPKREPGSFDWASLLNGKLVGRSHQSFFSEAKALEAAQVELDKLRSRMNDQ